MDNCEGHRYGRWSFIQCPTANGCKFKEIRSCTECGKTQLRSVERLEGAGESE